jgi:dTDP-4-dehydrorhamnose reductase
MGLFQSTAVIGADGMLGTELRLALERSGEFGRLSCTQFPETDITDPDSIGGFLDAARPEIIFNCAAFTNVDECENRAGFAYDVNSRGPGNIAVAANRLKAHVVHISTDYVFDGEKNAPYTEEDAPHPLSVYAHSKLDGEREVLEKAERALIVRTGWLYGGHRWNIVDRVAQMCLNGETLKGARDLTGSPTWTRDLADALLVLAGRRAEGIYHVVNKGACSRLEQIEAIAEGLGLTREVVSVSADEFKRPATVPRYSALSVQKYEKTTGRAMRSWREALLEYVRNESPARSGGGSA